MQSTALKHYLQKHLYLLILLGLMLFGLASAFTLTTFSQDIRNQAATATAGNLTLTPASSNLTPSQNHTIQIRASSGFEQVHGFQVVANLSGNIPPNIQLTPSDINGLKLAFSSLQDTSNGKQIKLAFITTDPNTPYTSNDFTINLANLTFTAPEQGELNVQIDTSLSKFNHAQSGQNILGLSTSSYTYVFQETLGGTQPDPSPTPTPQTQTTPTPPTTDNGSDQQPNEHNDDRDGSDKHNSSSRSKPRIFTRRLKTAVAGQQYSGRIVAFKRGHDQQLTLQISNLPQGLSLDNCDQLNRWNYTIKICHIQGTPTQGDNTQIQATVTDADNNSTSKNLDLIIVDTQRLNRYGSWFGRFFRRNHRV